MAISKSVVAAVLSLAFVSSVAQADTDIQSVLSQIRQDGVGLVVMKGSVLHLPKVASRDYSAVVEQTTEGILGVIASVPACKNGKPTSAVHKVGEHQYIGSFSCKDSKFTVEGKAVEDGLRFMVDGINQNGDKESVIVSMSNRGVTINSSLYLIAAH